MEDAIYDRDYNIGNDEIKNKRKEKLYEFAKQNNFNITREYLDYNFNEKGNMMNKLLDDMEKGKVRTVIFSSLDRIDKISLAMELRAFGNNKKRTWYNSKTFSSKDYVCIALFIIIVAISVLMVKVNGSRFYNPFM